MERETGFEPATSTLARLHSTTELFPPLSAHHTTDFGGFCQLNSRPGNEASGFSYIPVCNRV